MLLGALRSALSAKLRDGELAIVQAFAMADHKTKNIAATIKTLEGKTTVLLVDNGENINLTRGAQNLQGVKLVMSRDVSVYDLLGHKRVLMSEAAARKLSETLA